MKYLVRRLGFYLLALWASITINFFLPRLLPGDPAATILSGSGAATMDPVQVQALREALGLSEAPLLQQYLIYLSRILRFDFGTSFSFFPAPVSQVIGTGLIWTVLLGITSFGIALGFVLGGLILIEQIFSYPGLGFLLIRSVSSLDYPLMQGLFLNITLAVLVANFIVDILYTRLDPRVRAG